MVEFIEKNTGGIELGTGSANTFVDPYTGASRYTGGGVSAGSGAPGGDPLTGGSRYMGGGVPTTGLSYGGGSDPFTGIQGTGHADGQEAQHIHRSPRLRPPECCL